MKLVQEERNIVQSIGFQECKHILNGSETWVLPAEYTEGWNAYVNETMLRTVLLNEKLFDLEIFKQDKRYYAKFFNTNERIRGIGTFMKLTKTVPSDPSSKNYILDSIDLISDGCPEARINELGGVRIFIQGARRDKDELKISLSEPLYEAFTIIGSVKNTMCSLCHH